MPELSNIRTALAAMSDADLAAVHVAAEEVPVTPSTSTLFAAIAHAADWELHRRRGINFALSGPQEAMDPEHLAESLTALALFGAVFHAQPRIQALLDAIGEELRAPRPTVQ